MTTIILDMTTPIFTIGHSTHTAERFVSLLQVHGIQYVVDVRSVPFSRRVPHFNKPDLARWLREARIRYAHLPQAFGARRYDQALLGPSGAVDFGKVREDPSFRSGLQRLERGAKAGHRIALMCAEEDPLRCHRFSMVSYQLVKEGTAVVHIRGDGSLVSNTDLEARLRKEYATHFQSDLFATSSANEPIDMDIVYKLVERDIAFNARAQYGADGH